MNTSNKWQRHKRYPDLKGEKRQERIQQSLHAFFVWGIYI